MKTGYVTRHEEKIIPQKKPETERLELLYRRYMNYSCLYNNDSTTKFPSQNWRCSDHELSNGEQQGNKQ